MKKLNRIFVHYVERLFNMEKLYQQLHDLQNCRKKLFFDSYDTNLFNMNILKSLFCMYELLLLDILNEVEKIKRGII